MLQIEADKAINTLSSDGISNNGQTRDLDHFIEWRQRFWSKSVMDMIHHLAPFEGKTILEIGGRHARMGCLYAMLGASRVVVLEIFECYEAEARREIASWGLEDRVDYRITDGSFETLEDEQFDIITTKSVLWCIENLEEFLVTLKQFLKPSGKVGFAENKKGGAFAQIARQCMALKKKPTWRQHHYGVSPSQFPIFYRHFNNLVIRQHLMNYFIGGEAKSSSS